MPGAVIMLAPDRVILSRHWLKTATQAGSGMYEAVRCGEDGHRLRVDIGLRLVKEGENGVPS
jgi:hypothetical protein